MADRSGGTVPVGEEPKVSRVVPFTASVQNVSVLMAAPSAGMPRSVTSADDLYVLAPAHLSRLSMQFWTDRASTADSSAKTESTMALRGS